MRIQGKPGDSATRHTGGVDVHSAHVHLAKNTGSRTRASALDASFVSQLGEEPLRSKAPHITGINNTSADYFAPIRMGPYDRDFQNAARLHLDKLGNPTWPPIIGRWAGWGEWGNAGVRGYGLL